MNRASSSRTPASAAREPQGGTVRFSLQNWVLLAAGMLSIVLGYVLLARGDITAAPILLVLGYAVLIPMGIIR
jgi:uncharacterized membrane protein HdeD (DUF308 family)